MNKPILMKTLLTILFLSTLSVYGQNVIPIIKKGGVYHIPCTINGLKMNFVFDTGASDVSISITEALFMLKNGYLKESELVGTEYYRLANGEISEGTKIILKNIEIGNQTIYNVEASIVHNLDAPLLLGQSAIKRLGNYTFNYSNNTISFGKENSDNKIALFIMSDSPCTFYDIASLFRIFRCSNALYLDGAISKMYTDIKGIKTGSISEGQLGPILSISKKR